MALKIAFLPFLVAGHPLLLGESLARRGFHVKFWTLEETEFQYADYESIFAPKDRFLLREIKRFKALIQILIWADVVYCTYGSSLIGHLSISREVLTAKLFSKKKMFYAYWKIWFLVELKLYQLLNKKLFVDYQGDDIRQKRFQIENYEYSLAHIVDQSYYENHLDDQKRWKQERFAKAGASFSALTPDLLNYLPIGTRFLPECNVKVRSEFQTRSRKIGEKYVFVHAPSNRRVKGTEHVIRAIEKLKALGHAVELELVEGKSNLVAMERYGNAYMAIDQLHTGWYGRFSVECMSMGTPVLCFIRESDLVWVPNEMAQSMPIINTHVENIEEMLLKAISIPESEYERLRKDTHDYFIKWHHPDELAQAVAKRINMKAVM